MDSLSSCLWWVGRGAVPGGGDLLSWGRPSLPPPPHLSVRPLLTPRHPFVQRRGRRLESVLKAVEGGSVGLGPPPAGKH